MCEKYGAARRVLIDRSARSSGRTWVDEPELSDDRIREATGRSWDEWCELIEAWPGHGGGHGAIATWVNQEHGVDGSRSVRASPRSLSTHCRTAGCGSP